MIVRILMVHIIVNYSEIKLKFYEIIVIAVLCI